MNERVVPLLLAPSVLMAMPGPNSAQEEIGKHFVGKKVASVLDFFEKKEKDLMYYDEPPGKLRAISFLIDKRLIVYVGIEYDVEVFSAERKWDVEKIRNRPVHKIKILVAEKS